MGVAERWPPRVAEKDEIGSEDSDGMDGPPLKMLGDEQGGSKFAASTRSRRHKVPLQLASERKSEAQKQMLMYGHVELPAENFSFKKESGAPQCEDGCAFQDKVFTVEVSFAAQRCRGLL